MQTRKIFLFVIATLLVLGLVGCNTNKPLTQSYNDRNVRPYNYDGTRNYGTYNEGAPYYGAPNYAPNYNRVTPYNGATPYANYDNRFRNNVNAEADRLADIAARVNGVHDATVVIAGGNVYVGINLNDRIQTGPQSDAVERNVYHAVKKAAPHYNVYITSDADLLGRLRNIGDGIRNGTPIDRFQTDMRDFNTRFRTYTR
ncbi:YhcN/YlaJ family sporulation lipoprotein [Tepidibacillus fermentans]|uniref:YhcN/YlaJ family sporulation lipoprotein n=1 Tax=Tepidibacillus fermentans TaxID=1281767 RepID=A0A4R3KFL0_9BACI|nr:YhcN/YlaJ family sporulation lipoprotein [Tepidibacillus fermentans]TCS82068.1 YhcN/YlaJ family sporulation lipoprotein [Tepidibacillus fermentans]